MKNTRKILFSAALLSSGAYDGPDYNGREIAQCYLYYGG